MKLQFFTFNKNNKWYEYTFLKFSKMFKIGVDSNIGCNVIIKKTKIYATLVGSYLGKNVKSN